VVQRALVGAADVHAGAAADRLEAFEHLDRGCVVIVGRGRSCGGEEIGHSGEGIGRGFEPCQEAAGLNIHSFGVITFV